MAVLTRGGLPPLQRARAKEEGGLADPLKVASAMA